MNSILVVCEGNICRSPMAAGLFASALPDGHVASAGLAALVGMPADSIAIDLLRSRGVDISGHRAAQLSRQLCVASDIIFVMETEQKRRLEGMYPEVRGRVYRIGEHAQCDVPDPYRQPEQAFVEALSLIDEGVGHWLPRIERL